MELQEWSEAFTRIGNALGLEGRFLVEFGYQQIEEKARELREDAKVGALLRSAVHTYGESQLPGKVNMASNTVELICTCGHVLLRLGAGASITGMSSIGCKKCGATIAVDSAAMTQQAAGLPRPPGSTVGTVLLSETPNEEKPGDPCSWCSGTGFVDVTPCRECDSTGVLKGAYENSLYLRYPRTAP